jgi:hypothetical protein
MLEARQTKLGCGFELLPDPKAANGSTRVAIFLLIGVLIGAGLAVLGTSVAGVTRTSVRTTTITTTAAPGPDTSIAAPPDAVELTGCSISNDTCTFQITNFDLVDGFSITLSQSADCVDVTYGSLGRLGGNAATSCTASPSNYVADNGASTSLTAFFPPWSGQPGLPPVPAVGMSVHGCIYYTSGYGFGCLAYAGVFTA